MRDAVPFACEQPASFPACHSPCALMAVRAVHIITCASNAYMPIQTGPAYGYHADAKVTRCAHRAWGPSPASRHAQAALSAVHQGSLKVQAGSRTFTLSPHTATRPGWQPHLCIVTPYSHHARLAAAPLHCHPIQPPCQAGSHTFALSPHTATRPGWQPHLCIVTPYSHHARLLRAAAHTVDAAVVVHHPAGSPSAGRRFACGVRCDLTSCMCERK